MQPKGVQASLGDREESTLRRLEEELRNNGPIKLERPTIKSITTVVAKEASSSIKFATPGIFSVLRNSKETSKSTSMRNHAGSDADSYHNKTMRDYVELEKPIPSHRLTPKPNHKISWQHQSKASKEAVNIPDHVAQPSILSDSREVNFGTGISKNLIKLYQTKFKEKMLNAGALSGQMSFSGISNSNNHSVERPMSYGVYALKTSTAQG